MPEITYRNPDTEAIFTSSGEHIQSLEDYKAGVASKKYSGSPLDIKLAPWYSATESKVDKTSDVTTINTDNAINDLNKYKEKSDENTQEKTSSLYVNPDTGETRLGKSGNFTIPIGEYTPAKEEKTTETNTNKLTLQEVYEIFGNDLSDITLNPDGTFTPTSSAYKRIGFSGLKDTEDTQLEGDLQELDNTMTTLTNNLLNYNVENDPVYQSQVQNITQQYDKMRSEMSNINNSRKQSLQTLGYRTGSTQYAGAVQLGIVGEEIKQGDERIMEITRQENEAKSAARQAFETQNYTKFAKQMDALETLRENKADELTRYNEKLAEANKLIQEQSKFGLDVLKYQLDLKKSTETDLTKEYDIAKSDGFDGTLMDYKLWQEEIKDKGETMPTSYKEWQLAGGQLGTGKSYGEYIAKNISGPASYQEWSLAGGEEGTGITYLEYLKEKQVGDETPPTSYKEWELAGGMSGTGKTYGEWLQEKSQKEPTAGQYAAAGYASRIQGANTIINDLEDKFTDAIQPGKYLPEALKTENRKLLEQAQRNFINAVLRRESGAAIAPSEFESAALQYFPQPSDTEEVLKQKKANRDLVEKSMINEAGRAFVDTTLDTEITLPELNKTYNSLPDLLYENPEYADFIQNKMRPIFDEDGIEMTDENVLQYLQSSSFNNGGGGTPTASGMRTDRSNNPVAFTTDIAKQAGLVLGVDYTVGDAFPNNPNLHTAKLIGNPVDKTIAVIDKIGFYTSSGKQRWTHTAINKSQWDKMSYQQKKDTIKKMYQAEGNEGLLNKYFA